MFIAVCAIVAFLGAACGNVVAGSVAFSAGLDKNYEYPTLTDNAVIVFNKVFLNDGNGYNTTTGVFTAPKGGNYVFHIHALTPKTKRMFIKLYLNQEHIISAFARQTADHDSAGNTVILKLQKGDRVYVKPIEDTTLYNVPYEIYATFSGYLVGVQQQLCEV